eukprot:3764834-Rhodomonas_salina.3
MACHVPGSVPLAASPVALPHCSRSSLITLIFSLIALLQPPRIKRTVASLNRQDTDTAGWVRGMHLVTKRHRSLTDRTQTALDGHKDASFTASRQAGARSPPSSRTTPAVSPRADIQTPIYQRD